MDEKLEKPQTIGDCWKIYNKLGFMRPEKPLDASLFINAEKLVDIYNELIELREMRNK